MEEQYKLTLAHIVKWLGGESELDMWKPVNADFANKIRNVCIDVLNGETLESAIERNK